MDKPTPQTELRLVFQGSIPSDNIEDLIHTYTNLKAFVKGFHLKATINGQLVKLLEPCCNERKPTP
jgi:hypothetical protein